jgi:predicted PurR-regulated permease PerM
MSQAPLDLKDFALRVLVTATISAAVAVLLLVAWSAADMLLLVFAGILLAVLLRGTAGLLSRHARLSPGWSLTVIVTLFLGISVLGVWLLGPGVSDSIAELSDTLPKAVRQLG